MLPLIEKVKLVDQLIRKDSDVSIKDYLKELAEIETDIAAILNPTNDEIPDRDNREMDHDQQS